MSNIEDLEVVYVSVELSKYILKMWSDLMASSKTTLNVFMVFQVINMKKCLLKLCFTYRIGVNWHLK